MKEPLRLTDREPGSIAGAALRVARGETPPPGAHDRALTALGVEVNAARASRFVPTRRRRRAASMWGTAIAALVAAVAAHGLGATRWLHPTEIAPGQPARAALPAPPPVVIHDAPSVPLVASTVVPGHAPAEPRAAEGSALPQSSDPSKRASRLSAEVAALDAVRRAITSKDAERAKSLLDGYGVSFPRGNLSQEATILRVETLLLSGRRARAEKLSRDFLSANPRSGYRVRIERLLGADR